MDKDSGLFIGAVIKTMNYILYKGVKIECVRGSNWVYIDNRPFESLRAAKIFITKRIKRNEIFNK